MAGKAKTGELLATADKAKTGELLATADKAKTGELLATAGELLANSGELLAAAGGLLAAAGKAKIAKSLATAGKAKTGESLATADKVKTGESLATAGKVKTGESLATAGKVKTGESLATAGKVKTGESLATAGKAKTGESLATAGKAKTESLAIADKKAMDKLFAVAVFTRVLNDSLILLRRASGFNFARDFYEDFKHANLHLMSGALESTIFPSPRKLRPTFEILVNVKQFLHRELTVQLKGNMIFVCGKHCLRLDEHGISSRAFTRRYEVPSDVDTERLIAVLSPHGILTVRAPRLVIAPEPEKPEGEKVQSVQKASRIAIEAQKLSSKPAGVLSS